MEGNRREFELIERIRAALAGQEGLAIGPGDDAAVLEIDGRAVVSVDSMVEGVHFPRGWSDPTDIAHRAIAGALSDLAAMAARPRTALVALGLPPDREIEFVEGLADATAGTAERFGVSLAGGDVVGSPTVFISVTVIGDLPGGRNPVSRSGARPGDHVAVTGSLGGAAAGLALVTDTDRDIPGLDPGLRDRVLDRYLRPVPRIPLGLELGTIAPTAMIDVSDGLVADLGHLARASGISITLDADLIPVTAGVDAVARATGREPLDLALAGGEDYELAMSIDPGDLPALAAVAGREGVAITVIGEVGEGSGVMVERAGVAIETPPGFEHTF